VSLSDLAGYAQEQVARITRMQSDLDEAEGEGDSPRGLVHARTGPGGVLRDLRLDPRVLRMGTEEAAEEITAAVTAAQRAFAEKADAIMAPVLALRPSTASVDALDQGMRRLDALTADLERLARRRDLDS